MDDLRTRLDALEHHTTTLTHHTHQVTRQLRWWRGLACGLMALALLTWMLPSSHRGGRQPDGGGAGVSAWPRWSTAPHVTVTDAAERRSPRSSSPGPTCASSTAWAVPTAGPRGAIPDCPNGLGNLIVGYNEPRAGGGENDPHGLAQRGGGAGHNFSRFGGLVVGQLNTISGDFASVSGGESNTASGDFAAVSGGNDASGDAAVSGGSGNTASGTAPSVSGGALNTASGSTLLGQRGAGQ